MMFYKTRIGITLAVLFALSISASLAAFSPRLALDTSGNAGTVLINGGAAVRFVISNGNLTPAQRAQITLERLKALVEKGLKPEAIRVKSSRLQGRIYAGDSLICIATVADAKAAETTPSALAATWAKNIKQLIAMPPIVLEEKEILVPFGEARQVEIGGAAVGTIYVTPINPNVADVEAVPGSRIIKVIGRQIGKTSIEISIEGEKAILGVVVKKYAGRLPTAISAEVTGAPCPVSVIKHAVRQSILANANPEPGATVIVDKVKNLRGDLPPGESRTYKVDAKITGPDYLPWAGEVLVEVKNVVMPRDEVHSLFYSNNPESLLKYQVLFAGKLDANQSTRILYHHQNMMNSKVHFITEVINGSQYPAKLRIYRGISSPSADTVGVGHIAGSNFLREYQHNISIIETLPASSRLILVSDMLNRYDTASGILQIKPLNGEQIFVRITAAQPGVDNVSRGTIAAAPNPLILPLSDHIYPSPLKSLSAGYRIGERWAFIPIGKHALEDSAAQKKLYGNYGVTYDINLKVENPTEQTKKVKVLFEPSAGLASGIFIIDGKFVVARNAQPPMEVPLASYELKPGEVKAVRIVTLPVAGSNYPATLVVRS